MIHLSEKPKCPCGSLRPQESDYLTKARYLEKLREWKMIHHIHLYSIPREKLMELINDPSK